MASKPTRLCKNHHGVYTYRFKIPSYLQALFGLKVFKKSLHTKNFDTARLIALRLNYQIELLINDMKPKLSDFDFTNKKLDELQIHLPNGTVLDFNPSIQAEVDYVNEFVKSAMASAPLQYIQKKIEEEESVTSEQVLEKFLVTIKDYARTTYTKYKSEVTKLFEFAKSKNVLKFNDINTELVIEYVETLERINKTITVNDKMIMLKTFFAFAISRRYYKHTNPFEDLKLLSRKDKERIAEHYQRFTHSEVATIFGDLFNQQTLPNNFFIPLLGLYTGARLEELAQLELDDIVQKEGVYCIHINEYKDKNIKNQTSARFIPLHQRVLELGFIDYVNEIKQHQFSSTKIFPHLHKTKNGYGKTTGDTFAKLLDKLGITEKYKVFHSFRHTFNDELKEIYIDEHIRSKLTGHSYSSVNANVYTQEYRMQALQSTVNKLCFDTSKLTPFKVDIDLLHRKIKYRDSRI